MILLDNWTNSCQTKRSDTGAQNMDTISFSYRCDWPRRITWSKTWWPRVVSIWSWSGLHFVLFDDFALHQKQFKPDDGRDEVSVIIWIWNMTIDGKLFMAKVASEDGASSSWPLCFLKTELSKYVRRTRSQISSCYHDVNTKIMMSDGKRNIWLHHISFLVQFDPEIAPESSIDFAWWKITSQQPFYCRSRRKSLLFGAILPIN